MIQTHQKPYFAELAAIAKYTLKLIAVLILIALALSFAVINQWFYVLFLSIPTIFLLSSLFHSFQHAAIVWGF